ncbi:YfbK domain-containing protein [Tautonia rosea]|uniref:YfbK domain-containing protein n=1 Tax=Tautonia rosea TaxID=2728037 RepID=UPI0014756B2E|nr:YfbK domain-containing protein [Tautonia rosea]
MTFDPDDPKLTAFALGELDEADRLAVESLLARSPESARFVAEVREMAALLSGTLRKEPMPGLSIVQRLDLDERLRAVPSSPRRRFPVRRAVFAVAASVLLTLSGFGIGVLVADRVALTEQRSVAFTQSPPPGAIGSAIEPHFDASAPTFRSAGDDRSAPSAPEIDAVPKTEMMMAEADTLAEDEPGNPEAEMLSMGAVTSESSELVPSRSVPSHLNRSEPQFPGGMMEPSASDPGEGVAGQAKLNPEAAPDGFGGVRGGGFGGRGSLGRSSQIPQAVPTVRQPEPNPIPPPAPLAEVERGRSEVDQERGNPLATIVGTRGVDRQDGLSPSQAVMVQSGNVVEVINLPEGTPAQRFTLNEPIREVILDPDGSRLLASTVDRSVAVFDLQSGQLTNSFQVNRGPLPMARFGRGGELIFSNLGIAGDRGDDSAGFPWFQADLEPVAAVPVDPGRVSLEELGRRIEAEGIPVGPETLTGSLVNSPAYPYDRPEEGDSIAVDVQIVPTPWDSGNRLVRLALIAREASPNDGEALRPVGVEEVSAEVEFNRARVAKYRPIGFEGRPLTLARIGEEPRVLRGGESSTVLFEVEPVGAAGDLKGVAQNRVGRYQGPVPAVGEDELLTVSVAYRETGAEERRSVTLHVVDGMIPMDAATDDVRLASALGWLGLVVQGGIEGDQATLNRIKMLVDSTDEGFLPDLRGELRDILNQLELRIEGE